MSNNFTSTVPVCVCERILEHSKLAPPLESHARAVTSFGVESTCEGPTIIPLVLKGAACTHLQQPRLPPPSSLHPDSGTVRPGEDHGRISVLLLLDKAQTKKKKGLLCRGRRGRPTHTWTGRASQKEDWSASKRLCHLGPGLGTRKSARVSARVRRRRLNASV